MTLRLSEDLARPSRLAESPLTYEQAMAIVNILQKDEVILEGWKNQLLHELVKEAATLQQIKRLIKDMEFYEALLLSLKKWISENSRDATFESLLRMLGECDFNRAADELLENREQIINSGSSDASKSAYRERNIRYGNLDIVWNFTGRDQELKELHKIVLKSHENIKFYIDSLAVLCSVSGLGGVGKTTLSKEYANKYREMFDGNLILIQSESAEILHSEFKQLARKLNIDISHVEDQAILVLKVYEWFGRVKSLFIFDNVEELQHIRPFLPSNLSPDIERPYLLITGRRVDFAPYPTNVFCLKVLSEPDAIALIRKSVVSVSEKDARMLAEALGHLPLAIQQAEAYINNTVLGSRDKVSKFLKEFQTNEEKILKDETFKMLTRYEKTTLATWNTTMEKIKDKHGELLVQISEYIAYLNPERVGLKFLRYLTSEFNRREFDECVKALSDYSMVTISNEDENIVRVHRLVQKAFRLTIRDEYAVLCAIVQGYRSIRSLGFASVLYILPSVTTIIKYDQLVRKFPPFLDTALDRSMVKRRNDAVRESIRKILLGAPG